MGRSSASYSLGKNLIEIFKEIFPTFEVSKWQPINKHIIKIWSDNWIYIFRYTSSTDWSFETLKSWQREMKGD